MEFETTGIDTDEQEKGHESCQPVCERDKCGENYRLFKVFLSSPGGLDGFRDVFCNEVDFFNRNHAEKRNVIFRVKKWEDIPTGYGRPQSTINEKLATCDGYVLLLHDKWGSPPGNSGERSFSSGSEEEFRFAEEMIKRKQMCQIGVYFKSVNPKRFQSPDEQLAKVLEFKRWLENNHVLLYNEFADLDELKKKVHSFMTNWLENIAPWPKPEGVKSVSDYENFERVN